MNTVKKYNVAHNKALTQYQFSTIQNIHRDGPTTGQAQYQKRKAQ